MTFREITTEEENAITTAVAECGIEAVLCQLRCICESNGLKTSSDDSPKLWNQAAEAIRSAENNIAVEKLSR